MYIEYKKTKVYYKKIGSGKKNIVYLHGWGTGEKYFEFVAKDMNATNVLIDFPPFGKSGEINQPFTLFDYAEIVLFVLKKENIQNYSIISHSFGTRVAILLISHYNERVEKLIITSGAGLKPKNALKKFMRKTYYKIAKLFDKNFESGTSDYKNLSPIMKKTFSNIVNFHLDEYAKKIECKTLIVFGSLDKQTPIYMAKRFSKLIKNSKLIIYKNFDHFAYIKNSQQFLLDIKIFLREWYGIFK